MVFLRLEHAEVFGCVALLLCYVVFGKEAPSFYNLETFISILESVGHLILPFKTATSPCISIKAFADAATSKSTILAVDDKNLLCVWRVMFF